LFITLSRIITDLERNEPLFFTQPLPQQPETLKHESVRNTSLATHTIQHVYPSTYVCACVRDACTHTQGIHNSHCLQDFNCIKVTDIHRRTPSTYFWKILLPPSWVED